DMSSTAGVAILTRSVHEAPDVDDPSAFEFTREAGRILGSRSFISIPMLRDGEAIGAITVTRQEPGRFSEGEVALLRTFANQAAIAIENVRLFTELQATNRDRTPPLDTQTATSDILSVISRSQTDVQPVFDSIARSAVRLCDGLFGAVNTFDGELLHAVALHHYTPDALAAVRRMYPMRPGRHQLTGRATLSRTVVHVPHLLDDPEYAPDIARPGGWRAGLAVPMLREGHPIGTILVARSQAGPFSESQIELLKTFADQAVIAIENVRLFT